MISQLHHHRGPPLRMRSRSSSSLRRGLRPSSNPLRLFPWSRLNLRLRCPYHRSHLRTATHIVKHLILAQLHIPVQQYLCQCKSHRRVRQPLILRPLRANDPKSNRLAKSPKIASQTMRPLARLPTTELVRKQRQKPAQSLLPNLRLINAVLTR